MKFFVTCDLNEIESTDLTVEAPSPRVAEAKVRGCFPDCLVHTAQSIEDGKERIFHSLRPCLRPLIYTSIGAFALLFFGWGVSWYEALLCAPIVSFAFFWLVPICYFFMATMTGDIQTQEENAVLEREYACREGYREGWRDCERKVEPKFNEWAEVDRRDIHPYRGPLRIPE
jgi:hypothetical protein